MVKKEYEMKLIANFFKRTVEHGSDIFFHANLIRRMNCGIINPLLYHLFLCSLDIKVTKKEDYILFKDIAVQKHPFQNCRLTVSVLALFKM
jgi:hypothetical protein